MLDLARLLCCLALVPLLAGASPKTVPAGSDRAFAAAWLGVVQRFEQRLAAENVVGAAIVFTSREHGRQSAFYGQQDVLTKAPVDANTIFHWASITKTFTDIAATQLAHRGLLDLDAPAVRYLPELRAIHDAFGPIENLTLLHLMTHTGGLRSATWPWGGDQPWHPHEPTQWSQLVAMMPYTELEFRPGEKYSYSNPGYTFLGRTIEVVSGEDIESYVDKNVLRPLQMHSSYFDITPPHLSTHRSNNYYFVDGKPVANGLDFDTGVTNGNGGLNASVADMTLYLEFLSRCLPTQRFPLDCGTLRSMWQPVAEVAREPGLVESMGRGFFVVDFEAGHGSPVRRYIGHTGTQMGFRSFIYFDPDSGAGALIAVNTRTMENYRGLYNETRRDLFEHLFPLARQTQQPKHELRFGE
ncbi:MAG: serine hydrolase domain-containing protein [Steroidobacteraceae bacterium]